MATPTLSLSETYNLLKSHDSILAGLAVVSIIAAALLRRAKLPSLTFSPLTLILLVALALRLPHLAESLWYDETFSAAVASVPASQLGAVILSDVHPPLYYLILWVVAHTLGTSEIALRLPSLVASIASVWMSFKLSKQLFRSSTIGLIAAGIVAVLPAHIYYSVEARGYMLMTLCVQIALYAQLRHKRTLFAVSVMALPLIHNLGYLYAGALVTGAFAVARLRLSVILSLVPGTVWLPFAYHQASHVAAGFWLQPATLASLARPLGYMTVGGHSVAQVLVSIPGAIILTFYGVSLMRKFTVRGKWRWAMVAFGVPIAALLISLGWHSIFLDRAMLPAAMLIIPTWGVAVREIPVARVVAGVTLSVALIAYQSDGVRPDLRSWMASCGGDSVWTVSTSTAIIAQYYAERPVYIWYQANDLAQVLPDETKEAFGLIISALPPSGSLCIPVQDTPYNRTPENLTQLEIVLSRPHTENVYRESSTYRLMTYEVNDASR